MTRTARASRRDYLFLVNGSAGDSRGETAARRAMERVRSLGAEASVAASGSPDEARARVRGLPSRVIPVAVGGDGTVNLLVRALREERHPPRPIGVLPTGTGNALAHSLGIGGVEAALRALEGDASVPLDILATTHPDAPVALVSVSAGFEARFLAHLAAGRRASRLWSAGVGLALTVGSVSSGIRIVLDGEEFLAPERGCYSAGLYNLPCYAFGRHIVPEADPVDGRAHAVVYASPGAYWKVWRSGPALAENAGAGRPDGASGSRPVRRRAFRAARFESSGPLQVDGESIGPGRFDVRVEPAAVLVLAPSRIAAPAPLEPAYSGFFPSLRQTLAPSDQ